MSAKCTTSDRDLYQRGNVVYCDYWGNYDLILDAAINPAGYVEWVTVVSCKQDGTIIGPERTHCTSGWRNDHVVARVDLTA